jgi:hypothetical protein
MAGLTGRPFVPSLEGTGTGLPSLHTVQKYMEFIEYLYGMRRFFTPHILG